MSSTPAPFERPRYGHPTPKNPVIAVLQEVCTRYHTFDNTAIIFKSNLERDLQWQIETDKTWKRTRGGMYDVARISEYFDQECIYQVDWMRISSLESIKQLFDLVEGLDIMLNELRGKM
jgi:hypothetical protein